MSFFSYKTYLFSVQNFIHQRIQNMIQQSSLYSNQNGKSWVDILPKMGRYSTQNRKILHPKWEVIFKYIARLILWKSFGSTPRCQNSSQNGHFSKTFPAQFVTHTEKYSPLPIMQKILLRG